MLFRNRNMFLRDNRVLKFLALLLFTSELLASAFLYSQQGKLDDETPQHRLHSTSHQINLIAFLLCEEAGNEEERDNKDHKTTIISEEACTVKVFGSVLVNNHFIVPTDLSRLVASQPSLINLFGTYRI